MSSSAPTRHWAKNRKAASALTSTFQDTVAGETIADVAVVGSESDLFDLVSRAGARVSRRTYVSCDGTEIPITLVRRKDCKRSNQQAAILTSYGGFGVSMTPQFSVLVSILLELGAVFVAPNIRGGSEFSKAWHEAARPRNRQVAIDDFISSAEWLCSQHITGPEKLAIFGG